MGDVSDDDVDVVGAGRQEDEEPTLADALGIVAQQKQAIEALQNRLAELEKRDATTMDIGDLNDIAGERTRGTIGKYVEWHAKKRRDLDKVRFGVMTSGPEKGALDVRAALLTEGHAVAQVYPQGLTRYLAAAIKDSDDEGEARRGAHVCLGACIHVRVRTLTHGCVRMNAARPMQGEGMSAEDGASSDEDGDGPSMRTLEAMAEVQDAMGGGESDDDAVIGGFDAEEGERTAGGPVRGGRARRTHYRRSTPGQQIHRVNFVTEQIMAAHQEARGAKRHVGPYSQVAAGMIHLACTMRIVHGH